jgi:hypothetical protein
MKKEVAQEKALVKGVGLSGRGGFGGMPSCSVWRGAGLEAGGVELGEAWAGVCTQADRAAARDNVAPGQAGVLVVSCLITCFFSVEGVTGILIRGLSTGFFFV